MNYLQTHSNEKRVIEELNIEARIRKDTENTCRGAQQFVKRNSGIPGDPQQRMERSSISNGRSQTLLWRR
jgi:hypothetical protein